MNSTDVRQRLAAPLAAALADVAGVPAAAVQLLAAVDVPAPPPDSADITGTASNADIAAFGAMGAAGVDGAGVAVTDSSGSSPGSRRRRAQQQEVAAAAAVTNTAGNVSGSVLVRPGEIHCTVNIYKHRVTLPCISRHLDASLTQTVVTAGAHQLMMQQHARAHAPSPHRAPAATVCGRAPACPSPSLAQVVYAVRTPDPPATAARLRAAFGNTTTTTTTTTRDSSNGAWVDRLASLGLPFPPPYIATELVAGGGDSSAGGTSSSSSNGGGAVAAGPNAAAGGTGQVGSAASTAVGGMVVAAGESTGASTGIAPQQSGGVGVAASDPDHDPVSAPSSSAAPSPAPSTSTGSSDSNSSGSSSSQGSGGGGGNRAVVVGAAVGAVGACLLILALVGVTVAARRAARQRRSRRAAFHFPPPNADGEAAGDADAGGGKGLSLSQWLRRVLTGAGGSATEGQWQVADGDEHLQPSRSVRVLPPPPPPVSPRRLGAAAARGAGGKGPRYGWAAGRELVQAGAPGAGGVGVVGSGDASKKPGGVQRGVELAVRCGDVNSSPAVLAKGPVAAGVGGAKTPSAALPTAAGSHAGPEGPGGGLSFSGLTPTAASASAAAAPPDPPERTASPSAPLVTSPRLGQWEHLQDPPATQEAIMRRRRRITPPTAGGAEAPPSPRPGLELGLPPNDGGGGDGGGGGGCTPAGHAASPIIEAVSGRPQLPPHSHHPPRAGAPEPLTAAAENADGPAVR